MTNNTKPKHAEGMLLLRMPPAVKKRLRKEASARKLTMTGLILSVLAERFEFDYEPSPSDCRKRSRVN
jgi:hypothetical protein